MRWWWTALAALALAPAAHAAEIGPYKPDGSLRNATPVVRTARQPLAADEARPAVAGGRAQPVVLLPSPVWNWTGLYFGGHVGAASGTASFADPFGSSMFGDKLRTPSILVGAQVGFNWQADGSPWVFGIEADIGGMDSDNSVTCFAASSTTVNATCRVRPEAAGTVTGRIGYAFTQSGRLLVYGKGGVAAAADKIDIVRNFGGIAALTNSSSQNVIMRGWTVGAGFERALTPAWSLKVEYDYLDLGSRDIANVGSATVSPGGVLTSVIAPGASSVTQTMQQVKVGLNYKLGADPWPGMADASSVGAVADAPSAVHSGRWKAETGARYVGSWGQFHKDIGFFTNSAVPSTSSISRLTYDGMQTNAGEAFARVDTPWNVFVKGYAGGGQTNQGHMNDEDFVIPLGGTIAAYSNTLSAVVNGSGLYYVADVGYDFLRMSSSKLGAFAGYFYARQNMRAFGCAPVANINCTPPIQASGFPGITETDTWRGLRVGLAGEAMLTNSIKVSGEVAYLPYLQFNGVDNHYFGNIGILAEQFAESGNGRGLQLEALVSYNITPEFSVGVGGRYWYMWTADGQTNCTYGAFGLCGATPTPQQAFKGTFEQVGVFVQAAYSFGLN
jgi:opacity protein-like surface antigen